MRGLAYVLLLALWGLFLTSCWVAQPKPEDWLSVGFRSPEQTFRTFQTGLRAGLPDLEYRCLGADFKRRAAEEGFSQLGYREFRRELFLSQPWLKLAARAEIKEVVALSDDRVRLLAEVDTWLRDESFAVDLVREDYYELWVGEKRVADGNAIWEEMVSARDDELQVRVPLSAGLGPGDLGELRAGREWKIDGFPITPADP